GLDDLDGDRLLGFLKPLGLALAPRARRGLWLGWRGVGGVGDVGPDLLNALEGTPKRASGGRVQRRELFLNVLAVVGQGIDDGDHLPRDDPAHSSGQRERHGNDQQHGGNSPDAQPLKLRNGGGEQEIGRERDGQRQQNYAREIQAHQYQRERQNGLGGEDAARAHSSRGC